MKASLIATLFSLHLIASAANSRFILPEDRNNLIYFLQKAFAKKGHEFVIQTKEFDMPELIFPMIRNIQSRFTIYVEPRRHYPQSVQKLALYQHIHIWICEAIETTSVDTPFFSLVLPFKFTQKELTNYFGTVQIQSAKQQRVNQFKACQAY